MSQRYREKENLQYDRETDKHTHCMIHTNTQKGKRDFSENSLTVSCDIATETVQSQHRKGGEREGVRRFDKNKEKKSSLCVSLSVSVCDSASLCYPQMGLISLSLSFSLWLRFCMRLSSVSLPSLSLTRFPLGDAKTSFEAEDFPWLRRGTVCRGERRRKEISAFSLFLLIFSLLSLQSSEPITKYNLPKRTDLSS